MITDVRRSAALVGSLCVLLTATGCSSPAATGTNGATGDASAESGEDATSDATPEASSDATTGDASGEAGACAGGLLSCSGSCVDPKNDTDNCGSCGNACTAGDVCSNGQCSLSCGGGTIKCGSSCVASGVDPSNCGSCGHACATGQVCSAGQCATQCGGGLSLCGGTGGDGGATGLCVNEQNDPNNCGGCGTVCPAGNACVAGSCSVSCPGTEINCNGKCVDPSGDDQYCGATAGCGTGDAGSAGTQCPSGEVCNGGSCSVSCPGTEVNCNGLCIDPSSNSQYCGATAGCGTGDTGGAGQSCPAGSTCSGGSCTASCAPGLTSCPVLASDGGASVCVNEQTDPANCGGCGTTCGPYANGSAFCGAGHCTEVCNAGYADCSGTGTGGCTTNINSDPNNCGACGNVCPSPTGVQLCSAGVCADPPPAANFGASTSGDGWNVGLDWTNVYNVFHHDTVLVVACHNQFTAAVCAGYPKTVTDTSGNSFSTSGQPGVYVDQNTDHIYVPATRVTDNTGGVVCIDATSTAANPFCGFVPLTAVGDAPLGLGGFGALSEPAQVGSKWYIFNYVNGTATGTEDQLLCFDLTTKAACANQPFAMSFGGNSFTVPVYQPPIAAIGNQVIVPITLNGASTSALGCYDPTATGGTCKGTWPASTTFNYAAMTGGTAFPTLGTTGAVMGFCLPANGDPCFKLDGSSAPTPANLAAIVPQGIWFNGPAVTIGTRIYVADSGVNGVACYDYATNAACANFPTPKTFTNLNLIYTVNVDPHRPFCLWVNSDSGSAQIQNFDPTSGGACP